MQRWCVLLCCYHLFGKFVLIRASFQCFECYYFCQLLCSDRGKRILSFQKTVMKTQFVPCSQL